MPSVITSPCAPALFIMVALCLAIQQRRVMIWRDELSQGLGLAAHGTMSLPYAQGEDMPLISVPALYDGTSVQLLEQVSVNEPYRVLVTFVEPVRTAAT